MLFNSVGFLIFFPIVVLMCFALPAKVKNLWLLLASYFFYMCWNAKYILLILFSTVITYSCGVLLEKVQKTAWDDAKKHTYKNATVGLSFTLNLALLFYFKYFNFAIDLINGVLARVNIQWNAPDFDIVLPVGISFYTFQALGYTIDVYRGDTRAEKNFLQYALFVSFFPQLVAGPIERSGKLLSQLRTPQKFSYERMREGLLLMLWGFFLKIVLADRIAIFVDTVYGDYVTFSGTYLILATVLFAVQIYCDFAGYSIIAMGAARILGIRLMENFNAPYLSESVAAFWRNWHISLTSWFKDYLYIPLGGSRKGRARKYLNKLIVFLVSGLWHGASLSFVVWGGLNGLYQIIGEMLMPIRNRLVKLFGLHRESVGHRAIHILGTFALVDFAWIFFRAGTITKAVGVIRQMCAVHNPWVLFDGSIYNCGLDYRNFWMMILCICVLLGADICKRRGIVIREVILRQDYWCRWLVIAAAVSFILVFGIWGTMYDASGFIYFQF